MPTQSYQPIQITNSIIPPHFKNARKKPPTKYSNAPLDLLSIEFLEQNPRFREDFICIIEILSCHIDTGYTFGNQIQYNLKVKRRNQYYPGGIAELSYHLSISEDKFREIMRKYKLNSLDL